MGYGLTCSFILMIVAIISIIIYYILIDTSIVLMLEIMTTRTCAEANFDPFVQQSSHVTQSTAETVNNATDHNNYITILTIAIIVHKQTRRQIAPVSMKPRGISANIPRTRLLHGFEEN